MCSAAEGGAGGGGGVDAVNGNKFTSAWGARTHPHCIYFCHLQRENPCWGRRDVAGSNEVYKDYLFQLKIMLGAMQQESERFCKLHKNRMNE